MNLKQSELLKDVKQFQRLVIKLQKKNEITLKAMFLISGFCESIHTKIKKSELK